MIELARVRGARLDGRAVRKVYLGGSTLWAAATATTTATTNGCTVDDLVYDMYGAPLRPDQKFPGWGAHEAALGGVRLAFDWAPGGRPGPRPHDLTNPGFEGVLYTHHNVWGQVVPAAGGTPERRVRVQVDLPRVYHLAAGATSWVQVRGTAADVKRFEGGYWTGSTFAKVRDMVAGTEVIDVGGGHSWDARPLTQADGQAAYAGIGHWFYSGFFPRLAIPLGGQVAIVTRMRLVPAVEGADVSRARFLGCFSGDLFTGDRVAVGDNGRNPPMAMPRHKMLGPSWKMFSYVTGTEAEIRAMPRLPYLDEMSTV